MSNITFTKGNIFSSDKQTIVNTINCVGVMGKGVALGFRLRYPEMYEKYRELCKTRQIAVGKLWLYKQSREGLQWILNFPTKIHWKFPSKMEYIEAGLQKFVDTYEEKGITSIAFPLLGTHNGGLDKIEVLDMMHSYLEKCSIPIDIYEYDPEAPDELFNQFKEKWISMSILDKKKLGIRANQLETIDTAINNKSICSMTTLSECDGIGILTLQKCFNLVIEYKPQPTLDLK
ncbi:MAG: macro domain-containing protein [Duncaniella sp.]|uniref:macro domain-containing protein n=1 Tax=Duncaniella sp. TaxID=2518496 RepID=UPI0023CA06EB|nr:macro domain-containing protein [Duncaniella sp.]MDE6090371.1 macro domain-containing protein [Duncaniella sp.]